MRDHIFKLFATNHSPQSQADAARTAVLPAEGVVAEGDWLQQFISGADRAVYRCGGFDLRSVKKSCIHIAHPDGKRLIPFDTYNMFYRGDLEGTRLAGLRREELAAIS